MKSKIIRITKSKKKLSELGLPAEIVKKIKGQNIMAFLGKYPESRVTTHAVIGGGWSITKECFTIVNAGRSTCTLT